ncbi:MAG: lamin tail domain-containing protein, partial [Opitutaceae bacterium]|nr:lamin tail domain-containing protein [Verrucomicrobiales bacterium]
VYQRIQGRNPDGSPNPAYPNLIDLDNLIDYQLMIIYGGNYDASISWFLGNNRPNNWYGMRDRTGTNGFRFFLHDSEHTLVNLDTNSAVNVNRIGPFAAGGDQIQYSSPGWIWQKLTGHPEFQVRVADHVQRHFFHGGVLTYAAATNRFLVRKNEIDRAVVGESARWGDAKRAAPFTRDLEWITAINDLVNNYFPFRATNVVAQLKTAGLFPSLDAPAFNQHGGNVADGFPLTMTVSSGSIYFTRDGSDPRLPGGGIAPGAAAYASPINLTESAIFKARAFDGVTWSALAEAPFYIIRTFTDLLITEVMYNPQGTVLFGGDALEFIELKNASSLTRELSGIHFTNGIQFTFPIGTFLGPGQFAVLVSNPQGFASRYPGVPVAGVFGGKLSNSGEQLTLAHATGTNIVSFSYSDSAPWPAAADGSGFSLVPVNPNLNAAPGLAANWRASSAMGGSPGSDDPAPNIPRIWINEILTHTDLPQVDSIELHNPNSTNVNIRYWFLTDDRSTPFKYQVLTDTIIPAGGYIVVTESQFNATPGASNSFRLSSYGEEIYLYSGNVTGQLTGFSDGFTYGAAANGVAFGRYTISTGEAQYPAQTVNTLSANNAGPRIGPVVINEIHYAPAVGQEEFIELRNITGSPVKLFDPAASTNTWKINGVGFTFPQNIEIVGNGYALVVGSDPALFRSRQGVPAFVPIYGPYSGSLQNNGEEISLQRPDAPDVTNNVVFVPYLDVDVVRYDNAAPWPTAAGGTGVSLERINPSAYGNDPINWRASPGVPSPGGDNFGNRPPTVNAGGDQSVLVTGFPATINLSGAFSDDGKPAAPGTVTLAWSLAAGPGSVTFTNASQTNATATVSGAGTYTFRLTASDGELQASDTVFVTFMRAPTPATFITTGSSWKFFDQGSDRGTTWVNLNYDDSTWASGVGPLGYGDPHIVTTVAYGTNTANRHVTTWFRKTFNVVNPADVSNLKARYLRDDGLVVYLNGVEVFRNSMSVGVIAYTNYASSVIGGTDETTYFTATIASSLLQVGPNILAVEVHQANAGSSDLGFDLELTADTYPPNTAPGVNAGADFAITLPALGTLAGSVNDDGLPASPGFVTYSWSKISGPGSVTFSDTNDLRSVVSFGTNGTYVLRLTASDDA